MQYHVYVGGYTGQQGGDGIYLMELDTQAKTLRTVTSYPEESDNPSFLAVQGNRLYAVTERPDLGYISSFERDAQTGELKLMNRLQTQGADMCHLTIWPDGKHLSAANYSSGSVLSCSLKKDGSLGHLCSFHQHYGTGYDAIGRQEGPHVHSTGIGPDGKQLYVADLGLDWLACYDIGEDGKLTPAEENCQIKTPEGTGPRHFVFSDCGNYLYLVTEMGNRLLVYQKDGKNWKCLQDLSMLPPEFDGHDDAADIHFSADRQFLYVSCRGADCLTVCRVNPDTGRVKVEGHCPTWGKAPRNFCLTPDDEYVLIANYLEGNVVLCKRDRESGLIGEALEKVSVPRASFVTAVQKRKEL